MSEYSYEDGVATDWHLVHLSSRAMGSPSLVIAVGTAVTPESCLTRFKSHAANSGNSPTPHAVFADALGK